MVSLVPFGLDRRQEKVKQDHGTDSNTPTRHPTEEMEIEGHLLTHGEGDPSTNASTAPGGKEYERNSATTEEVPIDRTDEEYCVAVGIIE